MLPMVFVIPAVPTVAQTRTDPQVCFAPRPYGCWQSLFMRCFVVESIQLVF